MRALATRSPVRFAVLVTLAFAAIDVAASLIVPLLVDDDRVLSVVWDIGQYALVVGLLTSLGWWQRTGFATIPHARSLLLLLPLLIVPALSAVGFNLGTRNVITIVVLVEAAIAAGFTEEAAFRGVILRALEPRGMMQAAGISAALFGLVHLVNLAAGADLVATIDQVISAGALGFAFAAAVFAMRSIWPVIVIHAGMDVLGMLTAGTVINTESLDISLVQLAVIDAVYVVLFVGYGYWLIRRHTRQADTPSATAPTAPVGSGERRAVAGH